MTTSQMVPDQQQRTRDMGVDTESHDYVRRPFAAVLDALRELEISYGTAALAEAMSELRTDTGFYNRSLAANPDRLRSLRSLTRSLGEDMAERLLPAFDIAESTTPFPGVLAAA